MNSNASVTNDVSQVRYHGPSRMYGTRKKSIFWPYSPGRSFEELVHRERQTKRRRRA